MIISLVGSSGDICGFQWQSRPLALENLVIFLIESIHSSLAYYFMDWRHMTEILSAGQQVYTELLNLCVWAKSNGGMGSFYRSAHELVFLFKNGTGSHRNNIQLGKFGRNRTNVWNYPGANTFSRSDSESNLLALHPTPKTGCVDRRCHQGLHGQRGSCSRSVPRFGNRCYRR